MHELHQVLESGQTQRLHRVPEDPRDEPGAIRKVAYIIRHVTRYQAIQRTPTLSPGISQLGSDDFILEYWDLVKQQDLEQKPDRVYLATEGVKFRFKLTYRETPESVWVVILALDADWGIHTVFPRHGSPHEMRATRSLTRSLGMEIPPKCVPEDPSEVTDQFVVFACAVDERGPPSWEEILMPALPVQSSALNLDCFEDNSTRAPKERGVVSVELSTSEPEPRD